MGNISYLVPSIHPMVQVAPAGVPIHTVEFATWAASADGDRAVIDAAKSMAMTVVDLWCAEGMIDAAQRALLAAGLARLAEPKGPQVRGWAGLLGGLLHCTLAMPAFFTALPAQGTAFLTRCCLNSAPACPHLPAHLT